MVVVVVVVEGCFSWNAAYCPLRLRTCKRIVMVVVFGRVVVVVVVIMVEGDSTSIRGQNQVQGI